jgi:pyruvate formate lyase activating enzyme
MERSDAPLSGVPARWWHNLDDGRIQCDLCPRNCKLHEGQRAACFVRAMQGGEMLLTTYGRSSGFCIDPIEKKPLNNFHPGSSVLSFGTAGCNLACKFCQNWDISKSRDMDRLMDDATPQAIALAAQKNGAKSVAFTYNDPVIFAEYAMDTADACHALGIKTVAVTAGYMHLDPGARVLFQDGCRQRRPERLHRRLLCESLRRAPATRARPAGHGPSRIRLLAGADHAADSRQERRG